MLAFQSGLATELIVLHLLALLLVALFSLVNLLLNFKIAGHLQSLYFNKLKWLRVMVAGLLILSGVLIAFSFIKEALFTGFLAQNKQLAIGVWVFIPIVLILLGLLVFTSVKWIKGGIVSSLVLLLMVVSVSVYVQQYQRLWLCESLAVSGIDSAYGCAMREYRAVIDRQFPDTQPSRITYDDRYYQIMEKAAEAGDAEASFLLAGRKNDPEQRRQLLTNAAQAGYDDAAVELFRSYPFTDTTFSLLQAAADRKHADALYYLGEHFSKKKGGSDDWKHMLKAIEIWEEAAELGSLLAMQTLADRYAVISNVPGFNADRSVYWERRAIARFSELFPGLNKKSRLSATEQRFHQWTVNLRNRRKQTAEKLRPNPHGAVIPFHK